MFGSLPWNSCSFSRANYDLTELDLSSFFFFWYELGKLFTYVLFAKLRRKGLYFCLNYTLNLSLIFF